MMLVYNGLDDNFSMHTDVADVSQMVIIAFWCVLSSQCYHIVMEKTVFIMCIVVYRFSNAMNAKINIIFSNIYTCTNIQNQIQIII